jgi:glycosyltransferase involved in cell wall biosynthesis
VLEAMAAGTPVVALRRPFVEEVCEDAALLVDDDPAALADALVRVASDAVLRARMHRAGLGRAALFSWDRAAEVVLGAYREVGRARMSTAYRSSSAR